MSNNGNVRFINRTACFSKDLIRTAKCEVRHIKDCTIEIPEHIVKSRGFQEMIRGFRIGINVLDARKRFFFFFKRELYPHEKAELYALLLAEELSKEKEVNA